MKQVEQKSLKDNLLPGWLLDSALATTENRRLKALVADRLYNMRIFLYIILVILL